MNIKEVAQLAGVSVATVSRVINTPEKVRPETREKVTKVIEKYNYNANPFARNLMKGRTKNIVAIVPTTGSPFILQVAEGAEEVLVKKGYILTLLNTRMSINRQTTLLDFVNRKRNSFFMDGLILLGSASLQEGYQKSVKNMFNTPIVAVDKGPIDKNIDTVYVDESAGIMMAIKHLYEQGHKNLGVIAGGNDLSITRRRLNEIVNYCQFFNVKIDQSDIYFGSMDSIEHNYPLARKIINSKNKPSAIFAFNDIAAIGIMKFFLENGYRIPQDIAIISGDETHLGRFYHPGITAIKPPAYEIGKIAAEILLEKIDNPKLPAQNIVLPPSLVIRESC